MAPIQGLQYGAAREKKELLKLSFSEVRDEVELGPQMDKIPAGMLQRTVAGFVLLGVAWKYGCAVSNPDSKEVTAASGEGQNCHPMFSACNGLEKGLGSPFEMVWRP